MYGWKVKNPPYNMAALRGAGKLRKGSSCAKLVMKYVRKFRKGAGGRRRRRK